MNAECRFVGSLLHQALEYKHLAAKSMERGNAPGALIHALVTAVLLKNARDQWQRACEENDGAVCDLDWKQLDEEYVDIVSRLPGLKAALRRSLSTTSPARTPRVSSSQDDDGNVACTMVKELREVDCIYFRDLAGMAAAKSDLLTYFVNPLIYPNLYARNGARSILLYGLPGTGKTFLAKAAVNELQRADPNVGVVFYAPTGAELKGKYVGETEKRVAAYFDCAARRATECGADGKRSYIAVLFIDEIEAVAGDRTADQSGVMTNSVNVLLQKMDGISSHKNVVVLAATNFPDKLDSAVRRRFAREIHVGLPKPGEIQAALQRELARYAELALDAPPQDQAGGAGAGASSSCGAAVMQPACTAGFHNEPFDSLGFAVSSDDLKDVSETMYVRNFSNSDASRLAAYVINQAGNRALAGTFRPYRAKKYQKGQKEVVYLSDFAAPTGNDTVWVAEQKNSNDVVVGPFVSNGTVKYGGSTYAATDAAVKHYGVDGIQAVYQQAARAGLLVVGARTIGPYTVWVDVPAPPTLDAKTGVRGVAATLFGSTRVAQIFAKAARVLLIRSDTEAMEIAEPPAWLLSRLAQAMLVDAVEDQDENDDDDDDDDDPSKNDPLDMTTMFFRDVPQEPADVYTYLARALWTRRSALERLKVATAPPSSIPSASSPADVPSSANDVRRRLKTLFITKQDFVDGMATVRSTIRPAEKKHMDQIAATGHGN